MEMYFTPSEAAIADRDGGVRAFAAAGLKPVAQQDGRFWVVTVQDAPAFVNFQERDGRLSFASLEQPMLSDHETSHQIFCVLKDIGRVVDEESVG